MFERFTREARAAVIGAQHAARTLEHRHIGSEHLLLGILADSGSRAARLLAAHGLDLDRARAAVRDLAGTPREPLAETSASDAEALRLIGIDLDAVRRAIEANFGPEALRLPPPEPSRRRGWLRRRDPGKGHIPFTPEAKKALELSLREALRLRHNTIDARHLLLGILRGADGRGYAVLTRVGIDPAALRPVLEEPPQPHAA
jgi:ATP-dependent Clp protease ATP-binding subunit ClpA